RSGHGLLDRPASARTGCRAVLWLQLVRVLGLPACATKHKVAGTRGNLLTPQRLLRAPAQRELPRRAFPGADDGLGDRLRPVDRRNRLWLQADLLPCAVELRRVDRARKDHADVDAGAFLLLLDASRLEERAEGVLGRAVRRLQRDRAVRQRR